MDLIEGDAGRAGRHLAQGVERSVPLVAVFGWNERSQINTWSSAAESLLGWTADDVLGRAPAFIVECSRPPAAGDCNAVLRRSERAVEMCTMLTKDGRRIKVALKSTPRFAYTGESSRIATLEFLDEQLPVERRLAMLESVVVHSTDAVIVTAGEPDAAGSYRVMYVNDAFSRMTGYAAGEAIGRTPAMLLQGDATDISTIARIASAIDRCQSVSVEVLEYRKDRTTFWAEVNISPVRDIDGSCMYFIGVQRDLTARRAREAYERVRSLVLEMAVRNEPLRTQLARIVLLLKDVIPGSLGTVMLVADDRLHVAAADPEVPRDYLATIDGVRYGPQVGSCGTAVYLQEPVICTDIELDARWNGYHEAALAAGLRACWSIPFFSTDGVVLGAFALYAKQSHALALSAEQRGLFEETVRFAALVVGRHLDQERLRRMAMYDALTDLPNRTAVEIELRAAIERAQQSGTTVGVGVLDIDRFKAINDAFGHYIGDRLLQAIGGRMRSSLAAGNTIGRMAGDEFIVVFPDLRDPADGTRAALHLLDEFSTAFTVEGYEIVVRPSFGIAFYPALATQPASLIQAADRAMYAAKAHGGGLERATVGADDSALRLLDLERDLRYALERNELGLYYQMMYAVHDGHPVGAEALLRWNHPRLGVIEPADFVPLAEANGTIIAIGTWVIHEAAQTARLWQDAGRDIFMAVNVSALQFDAPGLYETVVDVLERYGLEPFRLHLELTESLLMRNPHVSAATLAQLKTLGVRIVVDDFGTGYSSLAYLQRFRFDALKIDRAFVRGLRDGSMHDRSEHIVAAVVALGTALGVATIAEGVENADQYDFIRSCGCTTVQGYFCARPVRAADVSWRSAEPPVFRRA